MLLKCPKCGTEWNYTGVARFATYCQNKGCKRIVKIRSKFIIN